MVVLACQGEYYPQVHAAAAAIEHQAKINNVLKSTC